MSQAGIVDIEGSHPQIPTLFVCNVGSAIPIANTLEILGEAVAAHGVPLETVGSGNTVEIEVQYASSAASSIANNAGVASFNSADFTVDANGYVTLSGTGAVESFMVDAFTAPGTNPVAPNGSGIVTVTGGQVPAGTTANVIRTDSLSANTYTIQIQRSQAVAISTVGDNGVSHFNSAFFTVDSNGFVSLNGGAVGETITGNTGGALSPTAGNWNIFGSAIAAGTTPVHTVGSGSTLTVEVQTSQAIASTNATNIGLAAFNSAFFTVDANGFVSLNGSAVGETITGNTGGALSPTGGNWNILGTSTAPGTTPVQTAGTGSTLTVQVQKSQAIASTNATNVGLAAFNSTYFTVDANGFVSINGSAIGETITGNTGGALSPTAGNWNILGTSTAAGTTPVQTSGTGSTLTVQVQKAQAIATTNATNVGLAAFSSAQFAVDANGFVTLNGAAVGETITGNTGGALSPTAGNWNILGTSTAAGTTPVQTAGSGSTLTVQVQKAQAIATTNATNVGLAAFSSAQFAVDANGFVTLAGAGSLSTLSDDVGTTITPTAGNIQLVGHVNEQGATKFSTVVAGSHLVNINPMSTARWIVDPLGFNGTHTTIASAITSATSGDTIFLMPGTYTENPTLKAGVNLTAYDCDGITPNVIINGKCTMTAAGIVSITGVQFQTNSDYCISVTGSNGVELNLNSCFINCLNNTGIQLSNSSASTFVNITSCLGNLATTGIALYTITGNSNLTFFNCNFGNSGASTTASSCSTGFASFYWCNVPLPLSASSTGVIGFINGNIDTSRQNTTSIALTGTSEMTFQNASCSSGTASGISIGSGCAGNVYNCLIGSSNTNAIAGSGGLNYSGVTYSNTSKTIQSTLNQSGGTLSGSTNTAPSAGYVGEQIRSYNESGQALSSATASNITSISVTPGVWDISAVSYIVFSVASTSTALGISTTSATQPVAGGDDLVMFNLTHSLISPSIASYRQVVTTTTTYYLVATGTFVSGTGTAYGRISATRVG